MLTLFRTFAGLVLGLVVFAALLYLLVVVNFSRNLVEPEVYYVAVSDTDAYNRVYDEVLLDEDLRHTAEKLQGYVGFPRADDSVEVLRGVLPPDYLREQTEKNIDNFTAFLRYEVNDLQLSVSLKKPLDREESVVLDKVHQIIDGLQIAEPGSAGCSEAEFQLLASTLVTSLARLSDGEIPESAPSLKVLTAACREREFDRWFDLALDDPGMNSQAARILEGERDNLRRHFAEGDTRAFLKAAADPLLKPLIEDALANIRRDLRRNDQFDLLEWLAGQSEDASRADVEEQAESLRRVVNAANGPGRFISLALVVLACLLMAVVHLPRPAEMLRWPGITLIMGGGVCLLIGFVLNSAIPGEIGQAVARPAAFSADVPVSVTNLVADLVESFARQSTSGFIPATVTIMVLGGLLVLASLLSGVVAGLLSRVIPGIGGEGRNR